jgi:putative addiction module component (TIGR02574 family)
MNTQLADILQLSVPERLEIIGAIWNSIAKQPEALPVTDAERAYIDSRLADLRDNPDDDFSWEEVRDNLLKRKR